MSEVRTVPLKHKVPKDAALRFLRVELAEGGFTPFALVRYAEAGVEQPLGLRDPAKEAIADRASYRIAQLVGGRSKTGRRPSP